ncbi:hypothetical protein Agub_g5379, partial [Astrephomene gubernaculifera]
MSDRRRSARSNNYNNVLEQQRLDNALKRRASANRPASAALEHTVLSEALCQPVWHLYEKYASSSPLLERGAGDVSGRSQRRRPTRTTDGGSEAAGGSGGGAPGDAMAEALAPTAAASAAEAAKTWEANGHHCLDLLEPLLGAHVTPPKPLQEALMHFVLNAESHATNLSGRAYALLERMLEAHPPVKRRGDVLVVNENLWEPVSCKWQ